MFRNRTQFNRIIDALTPRASTQRIKSLQRLDLVERRVISKSPTRENSQFRRQRYGFVLCIYLWLIYSVLCILLLSIFFSDRHVVLHILSLYLITTILLIPYQLLYYTKYIIIYEEIKCYRNEDGCRKPIRTKQTPPA
jgi:hypothetical protein